MLIRYHLKRHLLLPPAFRAVADAQVVALETFTRLENLSIDGCIAMTSIALNLPFLRHVSLEGCVALTQVCLPPIYVSYYHYYILLYFISLLFIYCFVFSCDWHLCMWPSTHACCHDCSCTTEFCVCKPTSVPASCLSSEQ